MNCPTDRLVQIWNGLATVGPLAKKLKPVTKFQDRQVATVRIWKAIQDLNGTAGGPVPAGAIRVERGAALALHHRDDLGLGGTLARRGGFGFGIRSLGRLGGLLGFGLLGRGGRPLGLGHLGRLGRLGCLGLHLRQGGGRGQIGGGDQLLDPGGGVVHGLLAPLGLRRVALGCGFES